MTRQRIRRGIVFVSFLFFPVTMWYFSPALIIAAAQQGIVNGSFIAFALLFVSSLVVGRAFCGWACPGAGLTEACFAVRDRRARGGRYDWIKYAIWAPWIGLIATFAVRASGYHRIDPLLETDHGISISRPEHYIIYYFFVLLIVLLSLAAGKKAFCHYVCWMAPFMVIGRKARNLFGWPALRLKADATRCENCKQCVKNCPMSLDVNGMVRKEAMENPECILCGSCVDICPKGSIAYAFSSGK